MEDQHAAPKLEFANSWTSQSSIYRSSYLQRIHQVLPIKFCQNFDVADLMAILSYTVDNLALVNRWLGANDSLVLCQIFVELNFDRMTARLTLLFLGDR